MPGDNHELLVCSDNELRHMIFRLYKRRVNVSVPRLQLLEILGYNENVPKLDGLYNVVDDMREILVKFIADNVNELSLPCDGKCREHVDAVVVGCYEEYLLDSLGDKPENLEAELQVGRDE